MVRYATENDTISITHTHSYIYICVCECDKSLCISRNVHTDQFNLLEHTHLWCQLDMLCEILHDINIYIFGGFVYVSCYIERGKNVETYEIYIYTLVKNNYNKYYDNILLYIIIILYYCIILYYNKYIMIKYNFSKSILE